MKYSSDIKGNSSPELISINGCGELRVTWDSHIRRYAGRSDYQLICIHAGHCAVTIENEVHIAYPGDCILYRPGEVQDYLLSKNAEPHTYWIHFNGEVCRQLFETLKLQKVHIIKAGQTREVEHLVSRICQYHNLQTRNHELLCSGLMQSILVLLSNEAQGAGRPLGAQNTDKISELVSRVKMVPNLSITVAECAEFCNMSKAHFARMFKRTVGRSPVQFMLGVRIDRAKELLDFTDKSIGQIAEASGFSDQNYFTRTFKKMTGMTPTQYRNTGRTGV